MLVDALFCNQRDRDVIKAYRRSHLPHPQSFTKFSSFLSDAFGYALQIASSLGQNLTRAAKILSQPNSQLVN